MHDRLTSSSPENWHLCVPVARDVAEPRRMYTSRRGSSICRSHVRRLRAVCRVRDKWRATDAQTRGGESCASRWLPIATLSGKQRNLPLVKFRRQRTRCTPHGLGRNVGTQTLRSQTFLHAHRIENRRLSKCARESSRPINALLSLKFRFEPRLSQ
jgi:hypothetical protein